MANFATRRMTRLSVLYALLIVLIIVAADLGRLPVRRMMAILPWFDKLGHFLLIGGLAFVSNAALEARRYRFLGFGWLVGSVWLGLFVTLEEISQLWLPGRAFELHDLTADFAGIVVFGGLARWWVGRQNKNLAPSPGETRPPTPGPPANPWFFALLTLLGWASATPVQGWGFHDMEPSLPCEGAVLAAAPPVLLPPAPPERRMPEPADHRSARDLGGGWEDAFYGVGFLQPRSAEGDVWTWQSEVTLPLYDSAGGELVAWLHRGWVVPIDGGNEAARPLSRTGMLETGYEMLSFLLHRVRDDGWMEIRVTAPEARGPGKVWVHACRLAQGTVDLAPLLWRDVFLTGEIPLFFRKNVPHALRRRPSTKSERIAWLVERDEVEALEIRGEWMRVKAYHPGKYFTLCAGGDPWDGQVLEGWVRWTSPEKGTWLYWPTRGC